MAYPARKEVLIADLATARTELAGYGQALARDLDVGARVKRGVRTHPAGWFGGAALLGLLLSKLPPLRRKVVVTPSLFRREPARGAGKAALIVTLAKLALDLAKPALTAWIKRRLFSGETAAPKLRRSAR